MFKSNRDPDIPPAKKPGGFFRRLSVAGKSSGKDTNADLDNSLENQGMERDRTRSDAVQMEPEPSVQKKSSGMFRRLSLGSKQPSAGHIEHVPSGELESQSEDRSRSGTIEEAPIQKKSSGFFKRLSIGSKKPSFDADGTQDAEQFESHSDSGHPDVDVGFDAHTMFENVRRANNEDMSETSSVSTAKHTKGRSGVGSLFKKKKKSTNNILFSIVDEFTRIRDNWQRRCSEAGLPLSGAVMSEFKKRISQAGSSHSKAKLNLTSMDLNDRQSTILVKELAQTPVLAKLELNGNNISTTGALVLRNMMACQLELFALLDPAQRTNVTFLGEVVLTKSKLPISKDVVAEIASMADVLAYRNVQNMIATAYADKSAPVPITTTLAATLWEELLGGTANRSTLMVARTTHSTDPYVSATVNAEWSYQELEAVLVDGFVHKGLLRKHESGQQDHAQEQQHRIASKRPSLQSVESEGDGGFSSGSSKASPFNQGRKYLAAARDRQADSGGIAMNEDAGVGQGEEGSEQDGSVPMSALSVSGSFRSSPGSPRATTSTSRSPSQNIPQDSPAAQSVPVGSAWSPSRRNNRAEAANSPEARAASPKSRSPESSLHLSLSPVSGVTGLSSPMDPSPAPNSLPFNDVVSSPLSQQTTPRMVVQSVRPSASPYSSRSAAAAVFESAVQKQATPVVVEEKQEDIRNEEKSSEAAGEANAEPVHQEEYLKSDTFSVSPTHRSPAVSRTASVSPKASVSTVGVNSTSGADFVVSPAASTPKSAAPTKDQASPKVASSVAVAVSPKSPVATDHQASPSPKVASAAASPKEVPILTLPSEQAALPSPKAAASAAAAPKASPSPKNASTPLSPRRDQDAPAEDTPLCVSTTAAASPKSAVSTPKTPASKPVTPKKEVTKGVTPTTPVSTTPKGGSLAARAAAFNQSPAAIVIPSLKTKTAAVAPIAPNAVEVVPIAKETIPVAVEPTKPPSASVKTSAESIAVPHIPAPVSIPQRTSAPVVLAAPMAPDEAPAPAPASMAARIAAFSSPAKTSPMKPVSGNSAGKVDLPPRLWRSSLAAASSTPVPVNAVLGPGAAASAKPADPVVASGLARTHSFGTSPTRSPASTKISPKRSPSPKVSSQVVAATFGASAARSPRKASNRQFESVETEDEEKGEGENEAEDDLRFAIDLSSDELDDVPPAVALHLPGSSASAQALSSQRALLSTFGGVDPSAPQLLQVPLTEGRTNTIVGIARRKFTSDEVSLLKNLPHCKLSGVHDESSGESKSTSFAHDFPKKPLDSLKSTPSSVVGKEPIVAGTCFDKTCANLDDPHLIKVLNECKMVNVSTAILRGNKCISLGSLRLPERFSKLIALDLSHNHLSGRIAVNILPPTLLRLDLSHNALTDFSGVMSCIKLQELNLSYNKIETIHVLPKTLVRLNIEHNYIWSKMCLRLLALSPDLRFVGLEGNPVLLLVPGWSVFLRSISAKLEYVGKHQAKHSPKKAALVAHSDNSLYLATRSTAIHMPHPVASAQHDHDKLSQAEQRKRDQDRSELYLARLQEQEYQREEMFESFRASTTITTSRPKPEHEILENTLHLCHPKYQIAKHPNSAKKKGNTRAPSFGVGRNPHNSFLTNEVWESDAQNASFTSTTSDTGKPAAVPKWTRGASLAALNNWIEAASAGLEGAVVLIAQVDQELVQSRRAVTRDDVEIYQEHLHDLRLQDCDPLPLKVKMALNSVVFEPAMIDVVTQLHRRVKDYRTILRQLETAMILSARDGSDFHNPFQIILNSPLGESLRKPATKAPLFVDHKRTLDESMSLNTPLVEQNAALRDRLTRSLTSSATRGPHSTYNRPTDQFAEALTEKSLAPWLTLAAHNQAHSASVLAGLMELGSKLSQSDDSERHRAEVLTAALEELRKDLGELNLAQYVTLPEPVKVALSVQSRHTKEVEDGMRILQAFAKLFSEVENVLQLCAQGGVDFEAALQGVMNSSYGRTVKKLVQGAPAITIVVPRSRSSTPSHSPKSKSPSARSPSSSTRSPSQNGAVSLSREFEYFPEEPPALEVKKEVEKKEVVRPAAVPASSTLSFAGRFYASVDLSTLTSTPARAVKAPEPIPVPVVKEEDPSNESIEEWIEKSEQALGRASIVFNSIIDLAGNSAPLSARDVSSFKEERIRLDLSSLEPPSMSVLAALHLLDQEDPILRKVKGFRSRLDNFDDLFARVENAMLLCVEDGHDFRTTFDVIMRTDLGQKINQEVFDIYDYQ